MAVVKQIAIHELPKKFIDYVLNPKKTGDMKYVTGIGCHTDPEYAYLDFRDSYTLWSKKPFCRASFGEKKNDVLLFHFIQSFKPEECTPELAHKIGVQWVKRVFGSKRPVLICTHDDKQHIHNHYAISVFDNEGKRWYMNKTTLRKCRNISDKLAREYGLSVIEEPQYRPTQKYAEWLGRKTGTSWKAKIADQIDDLIADENIRSVDDLVEALRAKGYTVNYNKYISIKPPHGKKAVRTSRLGDGYSLECLEYRITHKNMEISVTEVNSYEGDQREYAMCLREMQLMVYRKTENYQKATYYDLVRTSNLLCFLSENHITSEDTFKMFINNTDEKYRDAMDKVRDIHEKILFEEKLLSDSERFLELWNKERRTPKETQELGNYRVLLDLEIYEPGKVDIHRKKLEALKDELKKQKEEADRLKTDRKTAADNYQLYLDMRPEYEKIMDRKKAEEERQRAEQEQRQKDCEVMESYYRTKDYSLGEIQRRNSDAR